MTALFNEKSVRSSEKSLFGGEKERFSESHARMISAENPNGFWPDSDDAADYVPRRRAIHCPSPARAASAPAEDPIITLMMLPFRFGLAYMQSAIAAWRRAAQN